jgi:hypothetical protein
MPWQSSGMQDAKECEGWADTFEHAQVPVVHRGLAGPEAEDGMVGLAPLFIEE